MNYYFGEMPKHDSKCKRIVKTALWIALFLFDVFAWYVLHVFVKIL